MPLPQEAFNLPPPKRVRRQSPTHQGALFAAGVAPSDADKFASIPPYWTPAEDYSYADVYHGSSIYGDNAWSQSHEIDQLDQRIRKALPMGDSFAFDIFQPTSFLAQAPPPPALSTVSSVTYSSSSIVSQPSSAGSGVSPTQIDFPYEWPTTKTASTNHSTTLGAANRSTDSTASTARAQSRFICLGHQCDETFDQEKDLAFHFKAVHTHTCNWGGCEQPSFSSKDGLTWHVKLEHLLVCPAPGCTESSFQTKQILESHLRCAHPDTEGNYKGKSKEPLSKPKPLARTMATPSSSHDTSSVPGPSQKDSLEERALKQILSVTVSKKKCREKLRGVVERRYRRERAHKGQTPLAADSPSDLSRSLLTQLLNNTSFPIVWEHAILPFLSEFIPKWCGPKHSIDVRGNTPGTRQIRITIEGELPSRARKIIIAVHVRDLLPEAHRDGVKFLFLKGYVERSVWARGLSREMPDDICMAKNPYYFKDPCMGDSIGIEGGAEFEESTSTLGPCLLIGGGSYWLANFHPFVEAYQNSNSVSVQHPSPNDRARCVEEKHDTLPETDFALGSLAATSGLDLKTTRISHHPYWEECDKEPPLVATDWVLVASKTSQANILRRFPSETMPLLKETPIKTTSAVVPGATVVSTGRTSGQQRGEVCDIPAYVSAEMNGTGKATREWFIEEPCPYDDEEGWIRGGIGVEGDSGAAVVDAESNSLVGQLWGRNRYWGSGPRVTYFTPIDDLFDDIQEKCSEQTRPQLPQYRDESDCYPVYPTCRQCYDLRTYLDSRRSSRESLRSMIGHNEGDHGDLTSIGGTSELATPKDHALWARTSGFEELGSSFTSIMSPSTAHPFSFTPQPGTPGIVDVKSPYALTLSAEDLYGDDFTGTTERGSSKRAAAVPLTRSSSQNTKRQRLH